MGFRAGGQSRAFFGASQSKVHDYHLCLTECCAGPKPEHPRGFELAVVESDEEKGVSDHNMSRGPAKTRRGAHCSSLCFFVSDFGTRNRQPVMSSSPNIASRR